MTIIEAMEARHAVRRYKDKEIAASAVEGLQEEINRCNQEGSLTIQLILNDKRCIQRFDGLQRKAFAAYPIISPWQALRMRSWKKS